MKKLLLTLLCCLMMVADVMGQSIAMSPFGYCGTDVTGGGTATPTLVSTLSEFQTATAKGTTPRVVIITQNIEFNALYTIQDTENLTILALPGVKLFSNEQNATNSGILYFKRCKNIILRNITFEGPGAYDCDGNDCLCFQDVTNSWVDHCDFQDGCDGNFDNKNGTDNVTVSWCRFHYLKEPKAGGSGGSADHRYTNLLGSSSTDKPEDGTYNMTWAYCWWDEGCKERMLRCRNASLHFLGCYWNSSVANYYIGPENADAYIELCTFEGKPNTSHIFYQNYGGTNGATFVNSVATNGLPSNVTNRTVLIPTYSAPKYSSAAEAKAAVTEYAGATLSVDEQGNVSASNTALNTPVIKENIPSSATVYVGTEKTLSITASYADSYQWYKNTTANNVGGTAIKGATSSTYKFTPTTTGTYYYYCVATNSQATGTKSVASAVCTVTVSEAPTMWTAASATYNSTSGGYEVVGVGTYYKSTSGGTSTITSDESANWIAGNHYIKTGSSLFIFSPAVPVTGLKLYVKDSSARTLSSTTCSSTLTGTYSEQSSSADKSVAKDTYTDVTIAFNSTVAANQFIKVTFSGNVNVYGIEPITSSTPTPQPILYTITYNANGHGTCGTASWTQTSEGQSATLPTATADSGYTFLGWATSSSATSAQYTAGTSYKPTANVTLYAVYQQNTAKEFTETLTAPSTDKNEVSGTSYETTGQIMTNATKNDYIKIRTNINNSWVFNVKDGYAITGIKVEGYSNNTSTTADRSITITGIYADGATKSETINGNPVFPSGSNPTAVTASASGFEANNSLKITFDNSKIVTSDIDANGKNSQIYAKVTFTYKAASSPVSPKSTDATLSSLKYNGISVPSFSADVLSYDVELTAGTTVVPELTYTLNDSKATATVANVSSLPGTSTVTVTAEDGTTRKVYRINFTVETQMYDVMFFDGNNQIGQTQSIEDGTSISAPNAPAKDGYTFNGWSLTEDGDIVEFPYTITESTTFYAVWEKEQEPDPVVPDGEEVTIGLTTTTSTTSGAEGTGATWTGTTGVTVTEANGTSAELYKKGDKGMNYGSEAANYSLYAYRIGTGHSELQSEQYAGYKVTVADGYLFTLTDIDALMYASANVNWKIVIEDESGTQLYSSNVMTPNSYKTSTDGLSFKEEDINKKQTGTFYVKVYYYFSSTGKYLCFPKLNITGVLESTAVLLSDATDYNTFTEGTYNVKLKRSIPEKSWSTLVVPFDVPTAKLISTFPDPNNSEVAVIQRFENNTLYFKTQDHINANEPVLIYLSKTNANNVYDFGEVTVKNGVTESINGDVTMVGTYKNVLGTSLDKTKYYFISGNKFYDTSYMSSMKPFRAYFCINNTSGAKQINLGFGDFTTSMNNVRIQMVDTEKPIYNMAGQRVAPGTKGLLIQNGKKILVK